MLSNYLLTRNYKWANIKFVLIINFVVPMMNNESNFEASRINCTDLPRCIQNEVRVKP